MTVEDMHYDVKFKLNKVDSQQYRNLKVPEIDWVLNEACEIFIKSIAEPRSSQITGFEKNQRTIDDISSIVVNNYKPILNRLDYDTFSAELPEDYMFYISADVIIERVGCKERVARAIVRQHDDRFESSSFDSSSFEWKEVSIRFYDGGIKLFTDGTFQIKEVRLNYIKRPAYIHNAKDFLPMKQYKLPSGVLLTNKQDCELPTNTHREIVDIAVLILSNNLETPGLQYKQLKVNLNQN